MGCQAVPARSGQGCGADGQVHRVRRAASGQELGQGPLVIVGGVTADRLSEEQVHAWVARSCAEQGLPLHVTDVLVLGRVRVLLTGTAGPGARPASARVRSEPPDRLHPVRVQGARAQQAGTDDGVVQEGADDRGLPGQVKLVPRSA
jgi:hypothetical protein